jgi:hypothetical protein
MFHTDTLMDFLSIPLNLLTEMKEDCLYCDNVGWYAEQICSSLPWEVEQVQCEWCHTNPNSRFNFNRRNDVEDSFYRLAQESCAHDNTHIESGITFCSDCWKALKFI